MTLQPHDGKIIILSWAIHNQPPSTLTRYNPNGSLDLTFSDHGTHFIQLPENIHGSELLFDPNTQTLVVAGSKTDAHRVKQTVILRYKTLSALETETRRLALIAREEAARLATIAREEISRLANEAYDFLHIGSERHQCSICLEDIREIPTETACDHLFHPTCLNMWRTIGGAGANTCPTCRGNLNAQQ